MKTKLAIVIPNMRPGGAERVVSNLATTMSKINYDITIIFVSNDRTCFYPLPECVKIEYIDTSSIPEENKTSTKITILRDIFKNTDPDIILSFLYPANLYACAAKPKHSIHITSERNDPEYFSLSEEKKQQIRLIYSSVDAVVFQSQYARDFFPFIMENKAKIIHNPVMFPSTVYLEKIRSNTILSVGRIAPQKNYTLAIKAFSKLLEDERFRNFRYKICGSKNSDWNNIKNLIDSLKLNNSVLLAGEISDIYGELQKSDLFLMTSSYEGMPNAMIEALASGTPVVSCPIRGAVEELFTNGQDILIADRTPNDIAAVIKKLLLDKSLYNNLSKNARLTVKRFDADAITDKWEDLFNAIKKEKC